ncbi:hypothetical protein Tco_1212032 [Tanacetum coccineum]
MWNDLILAHEGPFDRGDTKIDALRLKFNTFKALEGEKTQRSNNSIQNDDLAILFGKYNYEEGLIDQIYEFEIRRFTVQGSSSKALISNTYFQVNNSDVEEDTQRSNEFLADLNAKFHDRALLANQKRFYKRSGRVGSARKPMDKTNETYEGVTRVKAFMAIAKDEPAIGKANARDEVSDLKKVIEKWTSNKVTLDQLLTEQVLDNIVCALGRRGKRKETISPKEVLFTKADESPSETTPKITSDSESKCDNQEPLPPLPKLLGAEPIRTSADIISLADLT